MNLNTSYAKDFLVVVRIAVVVFQNISCCYLSNRFSLLSQFLRISKHLMLLFISLDLFKYIYQPDFKTSHVAIYHFSLTCKNLGESISKHLMLLFIGVTAELNYVQIHFKTSHVAIYR